MISTLEVPMGHLIYFVDLKMTALDPLKITILGVYPLSPIPELGALSLSVPRGV